MNLQALEKTYTTKLKHYHSVHPNQISRWKQEALEILTAGFSRRRERAAKDELELRERLYSQIGQLKVELDWLKKKSGLAL